MGRVYKAYWDFTNSRWTWLQIDNLATGNAILDDCGRVKGLDPNFGAGSAGEVDDGENDKFYGFIGGKFAVKACQKCGTKNEDSTLCGLKDNGLQRQRPLPDGGGTGGRAAVAR